MSTATISRTRVRDGRAQLARAVGAPGPTLVLDADTLPSRDGELLASLAAVRLGLRAAHPAPGADGPDSGQGGDGSGEQGEVLKWALLAPSPHPLFDLDYRFVQAMPGSHDRFDLNGNCGHSLLAAITATAGRGRLDRLAVGDRVRVRVLNNGDQVVCEVDETARGRAVFTAHFLTPPHTRLGSLLRDGGRVVSMGNPYLFVDAARLGVRSPEQLFGEPPGLCQALARLREQQAARLGWPVDGAFPKVAAVVAAGPGRLAVRALTVPGWHPGLALTGAVCLAAASALRGTVPHRLSHVFGAPPSGRIQIDTPSGPVEARYAATGDGQDDELLWVSVGGKEVHLLGPVAVDLPDLPDSPDLPNLPDLAGPAASDAEELSHA
ncbi:PrpF domain-containing protein [Streptacidiphilus sp. EB129]|uniref:PrpF domain-containing protein n=1 Tax=Streptacidiphilus sp. EB129 TaxID=3156262 RepID=UPI0035154840